MKSPQNTLRLLALVATTCVAGLTPALRAQLVTYDFSSETTPAAPTSTSANVEATNVAWNGLSSGLYGVAYQAGGQAYARFDSLGTSFDENKFLSFTVTAAEGHVLNLSSLTISFGGNNTHASVARTAYARVRTDMEETPFSTDLTINPGAVTTAAVSIPANTTTSSIVYESLTIDLSDLAYQSVSSVTFRIYGYASASATNANWRIGDITLNGTISAIPEPASGACLAGGVALAAMAGVRRRRLVR